MCAIARGLMSAPTLLMIDELSLGLAPKLVEEILERLGEVAGGYVLETGQVVSSGESARVAGRPASARGLSGHSLSP
jgi:branched-chain amino acid transport system ATP-binding protein